MLLLFIFNQAVCNFEDNIYSVTVNGAKDPGFIIGKEAKLLDSLQHLLNQMINKSEKKQLKVHVDVDGYRQRRKEALIEKVRNKRQGALILVVDDNPGICNTIKNILFMKGYKVDIAQSGEEAI